MTTSASIARRERAWGLHRKMRYCKRLAQQMPAGLFPNEPAPRRRSISGYERHRK